MEKVSIPYGCPYSANTEYVQYAFLPVESVLYQHKEVVTIGCTCLLKCLLIIYFFFCAFAETKPGNGLCKTGNIALFGNVVYSGLLNDHFWHFGVPLVTRLVSDSLLSAFITDPHQWHIHVHLWLALTTFYSRLHAEHFWLVFKDTSFLILRISIISMNYHEVQENFINLYQFGFLYHAWSTVSWIYLLMVVLKNCRLFFLCSLYSVTEIHKVVVDVC